MLVRTTLQRGEDGVVDGAAHVALVNLAEDHARARASERLVRRRRHDVREQERRIRFALRTK